jgi:LemA protein
MRMLLWVVGFVLIAAMAFIAVTFNELVAARNAVRKSWSDIDVQLQRRHDLVPPLVATVKGYAAHESDVLRVVAELRTRAQAQHAVADRGSAEGELAVGLTRLLALQESYPDLKASENFLQLQHELVDVEDRLQSARQQYNESVRDYNTQIQNFPEQWIAKPFGFRAFEFFQAEDRSPVKV